MMNIEKARLDKMLQEHKVSPEDYAILSSALNKKKIFNRLRSTFLLNPFQKIAGVNALLLGVITLILTSFFGVTAQLYYLSPMSTINALALAKQTLPHPVLFLLYQNVVCWLVLAILLMIGAKILQKKPVRIIDFLGTAALARFPTLVATIYLAILRVTYPSILYVDFSKGVQLHFSLAQYLFSAPVIVFAIWQAVIYFYAYKESSGLTGKKGILSFLAIIVLAECIAEPLTTWFMQ
jgi:hypothetical protein